MARPKNYPYSQFNFLVEWDNIKGETKDAGFQEVSGLGLEINVTEYRAGNQKTNEPIKVTTTAKASDATFKRGVIGAQDLYEWTDAVRNGSQEDIRKVTVTLLSESREPVMRWKLLGARPIKYTAPSFNGKGTDLAIEELTLSVERIEQEAA
ncbi:MAG TPA: phage tail protein [Chromatiaceae bacterium]|mgnify:CR=1 FL=1|jgi:phage tail-like protein|nr:MAG: hypothetical protein N838_07675 [Thiohalocapsa sp. PB-PSB1]QQO53185.1 MAG: phage tail protein [Thiohalocapsa sp. PB-PSB1]HBG95497.1 phage tail protein [Chromatiaceae bacterium]HCS91266.1 phage tail protein [Chromatiaceae bacterium]